MCIALTLNKKIICAVFLKQMTTTEGAVSRRSQASAIVGKNYLLALSPLLFRSARKFEVTFYLNPYDTAIQ